MNNIRIGTGYDVHRWAEGRKLYLGGVEIDHDKGLLGHSDADVLLHAVCDALLGALALGDIGTHFPDTSQTYKNIDSKILLRKTFEIIKGKGYLIGNLDCMLLLERPKVMKYNMKMRETIAAILETSIGNISIKATTSERLGFIGREEGAAALATVLLVKETI